MTKTRTLAMVGVAALVAAGTVTFAAGGFGGQSAPRAAAPAEVTKAETGARFVCPMHPEVKSATRDRCSICGMYLEEVKAVAPAAAASPATTKASGKCPYMTGKAGTAHHAGGSHKAGKDGCCKKGEHAAGKCPHEKSGGGKAGK